MSIYEKSEKYRNRSDKAIMAKTFNQNIAIVFLITGHSIIFGLRVANFKTW